MQMKPSIFEDSLRIVLSATTVLASDRRTLPVAKQVHDGKVVYKERADTIALTFPSKALLTMCSF